VNEGKVGKYSDRRAIEVQRYECHETESHRAGEERPYLVFSHEKRCGTTRCVSKKRGDCAEEEHGRVNDHEDYYK
jgi:hypothetical protein